MNIRSLLPLALALVVGITATIAPTPCSAQVQIFTVGPDGQYATVSAALADLLAAPYGNNRIRIEAGVTTLENISLPPEVEEAIDKRSGMAAVGDLNEYVKYQLGQGMESGGGGSGGMATEMAVGLAIAQQIMQQQGAGLTPGTPAGASTAPAMGGSLLPDLMSVEQVAQALGVSTDDVSSIVESGELAAKKIGSSVRIKRSALEAYLAD